MNFLSDLGTIIYAQVVGLYINIRAEVVKFLHVSSLEQ